MLPCRSRSAGAVATGVPHQHCSLCYRGSSRRLLQEAVTACRPVWPLQEHRTQRCRRRAACYRGTQLLLLQEDPYPCSSWTGGRLRPALPFPLPLR